MKDGASTLYVQLLKRCLTRTLFPDATWDWNLTRIDPFDPKRREIGQDWPTEAVTMAGMRRLDHLQSCIETALLDQVPGDLVETGVWRGGCGILTRAVLAAHQAAQGCVWLADSSQGLPPPSPEEYPQDADDIHSQLTSYLGVSLETVRRNFEQFDLLDSRVRFLPGWFRDTLPDAPVQQIAVLTTRWRHVRVHPSGPLSALSQGLDRRICHRGRLRCAAELQSRPSRIFVPRTTSQTP